MPFHALAQCAHHEKPIRAAAAGESGRVALCAASASARPAQTGHAASAAREWLIRPEGGLVRVVVPAREIAWRQAECAVCAGRALAEAARVAARGCACAARGGA